MDKRLTTFLWFDDQAEQAVDFYTATFAGASVGRVLRHTEPERHDAVQLIEFELSGQRFAALNGGPGHPFTDAISVVVPCADQAEVDYYWDRLGDGGQEIVCGWLRDRYGLCWQIVPAVLLEVATGPDRDAAARVMAAMNTMVKLDVAALERAAAGS